MILRAITFDAGAAIQSKLARQRAVDLATLDRHLLGLHRDRILAQMVKAFYGGDTPQRLWSVHESSSTTLTEAQLRAQIETCRQGSAPRSLRSF